MQEVASEATMAYFQVTVAKMWQTHELLGIIAAE